MLARTAPLTRRPTIPAAVRDRARTKSLVKREARRATLAEAAIFVPAPGGSARLLLEARASGCAIAEPAGLADQPELAAASVARLVDDEALRSGSGDEGPRCRPEAGLRRARKATRRRVREDGRPSARRQPIRPTRMAIPSETGTGSWSTSTCTPTARTTARSSRRHWSSTPRRRGLGAIAVTDHNVFAGALETVEIARNRKLVVIPGEEVKTDNQGEVIGLFLSEEIPGE